MLFLEVEHSGGTDCEELAPLSSDLQGVA